MLLQQVWLFEKTTKIVFFALLEEKSIFNGNLPTGGDATEKN